LVNSFEQYSVLSSCIIVCRRVAFVVTITVKFVVSQLHEKACTG